MLKKLLQRLRELAEEAKGIYATAKTEKRAVTDEGSERLKALDGLIATVEVEIIEAKHQARFESVAEGAAAEEARLAAIPPEGPLDVPAVTEDRSVYAAWPEEHDADYFRMIVATECKRDLPRDIHEELRTTFAAELRAPTGQGTVIDSEGGALVPANMSQRIFQKIHKEGQLLSRVQEVPISVGSGTEWPAVKENARTSGNRYGGITVARTGEGAAATASQIEIEKIKLVLKKLTALVYLTEEQLADGAQMLTLINQLTPLAIRFKIEDEIINGVSGIQMQGILNADSLVTVAKEGSQSADTILYLNVIKMWTRLVASSRAKSVWFINPDIEPQLFTMTLEGTSSSVPVYLPANGASGSPFGTLFGRPVIPIEHCDTLGNVGDIILADLSQYLYAFKGGLQRSQSIHVRFVEGETAFRFMFRNDGNSWWSAALTPAKGSNTVSPFVTLAVRS